jgi:hypothetical protein
MQGPSPSTAVRQVRRLSIAAAGLIAAFALLVPSVASAAAFSAKVHFPNHNPIANKPWVITWTANRGGQKLSGSSKYEFFVGSNASGSPVSTQKGVSFRNGKGRDTLKFPGEAVGHQLTLDVLISTKYGTVSIPWVLTTKQ